MAGTPEGPQERIARATVMVTPDEKRAIRFVAAARDITESDLVREVPVSKILREYARLTAALPKVA